MLHGKTFFFCLGVVCFHEPGVIEEKTIVNQDIYILFRKYQQGQCTPEEVLYVLDLVAKGLYHDEWQEALADDAEQLLNQPRPDGQQTTQSWFGYRTAFIGSAAAILLVLTGVLVWFDQSDRELVTHLAVEGDILPGSNRAIISYGGRRLELEDDSVGVEINKKTIRYKGMEHRISDAEKWHEADGGEITIETPIGGQYKATLPDGTKVWLNAATSLKIPANFGKSKRVVQLQGEAYFAVNSLPVKARAKVPFIVKTDGQQMTVLGTEFNVSAYWSERIKTTLVNGALKVGAEGSADVLLHPAEQSATNHEGKLIKYGVDISQEVAWKNGLFDFTGMKVDQVAKQLERWYAIEIKIEGKIPTVEFVGKMYRNRSLDQAIEILESAGFKIERTENVVSIKGK